MFKKPKARKKSSRSQKSSQKVPSWFEKNKLKILAALILSLFILGATAYSVYGDRIFRTPEMYLAYPGDAGKCAKKEKNCKKQCKKKCDKRGKRKDWDKGEKRACKADCRHDTSRECDNAWQNCINEAKGVPPADESGSCNVHCNWYDSRKCPAGLKICGYGKGITDSGETVDQIYCCKE